MWVVRDNSGISAHPASLVFLEDASWGLEDEGGATDRTQESCRMTTEATALESGSSLVPHGVLWRQGTLRLLRAGSYSSSPCCESLCVYVKGTGSAVILLSLFLPTWESKIQFPENIGKHNGCRHRGKYQKALGVSASSRWSPAQMSAVWTDEPEKGSVLSQTFPPFPSWGLIAVSPPRWRHTPIPLLHLCL